jgi:hypothetical protein
VWYLKVFIDIPDIVDTVNKISLFIAMSTIYLLFFTPTGTGASLLKLKYEVSLPGEKIFKVGQNGFKLM